MNPTDMQFSPDQAKILHDILTWRRDVRHFKSESVPPEVLERLRRAMALAPSVGNARPWRVILVRNPQMRAAVRKNFTDCNARAATIYRDARAQAYAKLKLAGLDCAPEQLAVFTVQDPQEGHELGRRTMASTLEQSTAMAIHTFWLAARAENLGVGMVSILDPEEIERIFSTPKNWRLSAYLCLGWPEGVDDVPLLERVGWQENTPTLWEVLE